MDPVIKTRHEARVGEEVKLAMRHPEFQNRAHPSFLLKVWVDPKSEDCVFKPVEITFSGFFFFFLNQFPELANDT